MTAVNTWEGILNIDYEFVLAALHAYSIIHLPVIMSVIH